MKQTLLVNAICGLLCFGTSVALTGCNTFVKNAQKTSYALHEFADADMKGWAVFYKNATNNPAQFGLASADVEKLHQEVNGVARKTGASLRTLETFIGVYQTNSAAKPALLAALSAAAATVPELTALIEQITGKTNTTQLLP